jgi:hypothetical protein
MYELDLSRVCSKWDSKPQVGTINSMAWGVEKVRCQTRPLQRSPKLASYALAFAIAAFEQTN